MKRNGDESGNNEGIKTVIGRTLKNFVFILIFDVIFGIEFFTILIY
jgi:hypothetical protein